MSGAKGHGGGIWAAARETGRNPEEILDFSASINPLGIPASVLQAAREALAGAVHYPEIDGASLRSALAEFHHLPMECLLPGNGSTELIYLLPRMLRPRRALVVTPAFSEYARALQAAEVGRVDFPLDPGEGFALRPETVLERLHEGVDLIVLANPGNPAGTGIDPGAILALAQGALGRALVVVDEAFADFCPGRSVLSRVPDLPNLIVLRSLTKFYAIPGLRAGFLAAPPEVVQRLEAGSCPWSLSAPALAAARACLKAQGYRRNSLELIPRLRRQLEEGLESLGLTVFPSEANYLLCRLEEGGDAAALSGRLRQEGILIRNCSNFPPLDRRYFRLAVRSAEENGRLLEALCGALGRDKATSPCPG